MRTIGEARHWVVGIVVKMGKSCKRQVSNIRIFQFSKKTPHPIQGINQALDLAATTIPHVSSVLETRFMATAAILEKLNDDGRNIVLATDRLVNSATGKGDGKKILEGAMAVVEGPLELLSDCYVQSQDLYEKLQSYTQGIIQLQRKEPELRRAMAPLRFMQALLKIESATLSAEAQAMFNALSLEIERLQGQMYELFNTKFAELNEVQHILQNVCTSLKSHTTSLREFISLEKIRIQESLTNIQKELDENLIREARILQLSKTVAKEIQKVVAGLQFQDIVSQKLAHISTALTKTGTEFRLNQTDLHSLLQSFNLQSHQLNAVRQNIRGAQTDVRSGVESILDQLLKADSDCISLKDLSKITTSADGTVQTLLDDIRGVAEQVDSVVSGSSEVHDALQPVSGLASSVTSVVKELSLSIHLIGLNAQVQAAQFSQGAGLGVISYRMSEISGVTSLLSKSIAADLDFVSNGLSQSIISFKELNAKSLSQQRFMETDGKKSEMDLHRLRDDALNSVHTIGRLVTKISSTSKSCLNTVDYGDISDPELKQLQESLESIASTLPLDEGATGDDLTGIVKDFHADYTMESERIIFAEATSKKTSRPQAIEPSLQAAAPGEIQSKSTGNVSEITVDQKSLQLVGAEKPAHSEFGDNVDLF